MKVLVAGATGVVGRQVVPQLVAAGHDVVALSRSGALVPDTDPDRVVVEAADALEPDAVRAVVERHRPDAVVHLLTRIPQRLDGKHLARDFETTNRLRTEGLRHLVDAVRDTGPVRLVVQGLAYGYDPDAVAATALATEEDPLWRDPPAQWRSSRDALAELERLTAEHGGLVLRFGHLYGPGTVFAADGDVVEQVRAGRLPVIGGGRAVFSFTHTHDAASAVVAALGTGATGALNVVDDDPVTVHDWLPHLADVLDAAPPRSVPAFLARLVAGSWGVAFFTRLRGADNSRARSELGWVPTRPSWRDAIRVELT